MKANVTIEGYAEIRKLAKDLPAKYQRDVYRTGFREAAKWVKNDASGRAQIGKRAPRTRKGGTRVRLKNNFKYKLFAWNWDGVRVPKSAAVVYNKSPHFIFIEKGTSNRRSRFGNKGRVKARPMLEPALKNRSALLQQFRNGAKRAFDRATRAIARKAATLGR